MARSLTPAIFEGHEQETFYLMADETLVACELVEVERIKMPPPKKWGSAGHPLREEPFKIVFRGSLEHLLPQRTYPVRHDGLGELGGIFVVPIDKDEKGYYYEAIFN